VINALPLRISISGVVALKTCDANERTPNLWVRVETKVRKQAVEEREKGRRKKKEKKIK
jgi:hypothetical protein